jgi:hypothetical protein
MSIAAVLTKAKKRFSLGAHQQMNKQNVAYIQNGILFTHK